MLPSPSHESPVYVLLPASARPGEALRLLLSSPDVRQHWLPPLWALERAGIDLAAALPDVTSVTLGTLPRVVETLLRLATPAVLDDLCRRTWRDADERVRQHYLGGGLRRALAGILRAGPRTRDLPAPEAFRADRVAESGFEVQYRIAPGPEERDALAPSEEASAVLYPFDPANEAGRRELRLGAGAETILEVFAYEAGRARHRAVLEGIARGAGWRVVDPRA